MNLSYYKGEQENQVYDPGAVYTTNLNNIIEVPLPTGSTFTRTLSTAPRFFDLRDSRDEGWELEATANPTPSWRVSFNAAIPRAYQTSNAKKFTAYMVANDTSLRQLLAATNVTIDSNNFASTTNADAASAAAGWNYLQTQLSNNVQGDQLQTNLNYYTANLFTDYRFRLGVLNGFRVGGGVNFRGKQVIGYRGADTIVDPSNASNAIDNPNVSAFDVVTADAYNLVTLTLGYQLRLKKKLKANLGLTVTNLLDYDKPIYYRTLQRPVDGNLRSPAREETPSFYRYINPRAYTFTASFDF
ncbi:MAG: hypothetical protein JNG82_12850 [Opitutaceae bacterium]|nr:hypothetical protein [Opitutaceae bacterium]